MQKIQIGILLEHSKDNSFLFSDRLHNNNNKNTVHNDSITLKRERGGGDDLSTIYLPLIYIHCKYYYYYFFLSLLYLNYGKSKIKIKVLSMPCAL